MANRVHQFIPHTTRAKSRGSDWGGGGASSSCTVDSGVPRIPYWGPCCSGVELVLQFPAWGSTQVLLCLFLVCCGCDTSYIVSVHIQCQASYIPFVVLRAFMAGAASQAGDADSSRAPDLTSGLQGSMNVHRGALLLVPQ